MNIDLFISDPISIFAVIMLLSVVFVNGMTDASNAIATAVGSKVLSFRNAGFLSAAMNVFGLIVSCAMQPKVTHSIVNMFNVYNVDNFNVSLSAALMTVLVWTVIAWFFGIPTSESHALTSAITGAAIAIGNDLSVINVDQWFMLIWGIILSCATGVILAFLFEKLLTNKKLNCINFRLMQIINTGLISIMHGSQDGQKFLAVLLMLFLSKSNNTEILSEQYLYLVIIVAIVMGIGTLAGGKRIVKTVGSELVVIDNRHSLASDLATVIGLIISTYSGAPVSTTHVKTMSVIGAGIAKNKDEINFSLLKDVFLAWILTLPGCMFLGYLLTKLMLVLL